MPAPVPLCVAGDSDAIAGQCYAADWYFTSTGEWISPAVDTGSEINDIGTLAYIAFDKNVHNTSYTRNSVVYPVQTDMKIQTRTASSESGLLFETWGADDGTGTFSPTAYYDTGDKIALDPSSSGRRFIQVRVQYTTTDTKYSPFIDRLFLKRLGNEMETIDVTDYIEPMDDIEIIVDNEKLFSGTLEDINPDYCNEEKVGIAGYGSSAELSYRTARWQYNDYLHNIVRDLINRFNVGGKIQITQSSGTNSTFLNGSKIVAISGLDLTTLVSPSWIRLKQSATEYKYYKISSITNSGSLLLVENYDGNQTSDSNFLIDDLDCDDFTDAGLIYAQFVNDTIITALAYLAPLGIALFWVDSDYKLHFKEQNVVVPADHTYFKDYNIKVLNLKSTSRNLKNRGILVGGEYLNNLLITDIGATTITDSSQKLNANAYKGFTVTVTYDESGGGLEGTTYHVSANTADTLTIGAHLISCGDFVTLSGRIFEVIQNSESIVNTGKIREFIVNDTSVLNPYYAKFVLLKMLDKSKDVSKEGLLKLPFGDLSIKTGQVVDLRGFTTKSEDNKSYWDSFNWDEANWSTESYDIFKFQLTKFTHNFQKGRVDTEIEISNSLPTMEDMFKDIEARMRNNEQTTEQIPAYQYLSDFINPLYDSRPEGTSLSSTFTRGLQIYESDGSIIAWA